MIDVVITDDVGTWLRKLKDRQGKLRISDRIDRLAHGIRATSNRSAKASRNYD